MLKNKINKIQHELREQKLDALLIGNFGFNHYDDLLNYLLLTIPEYAILFIPNIGKTTLYTIPFETEQRRQDYPELKVLPLDKPIEDVIKKHTQKRHKLSVRLSNLPASVYKSLMEIKNIRWYDLQNDNHIMAVKLPEEIKLLKQAAKITDEIFSKLIKNWGKFKTELDAANFVQVECAKRGVEPSFPTIVASGPNAANPHYHPHNTKIKPGFCVIDMGVKYHGYCSDMTRTIYIGKPSKAALDLYGKLLKAQISTTKKVSAGVSTAEVDSFCRETLGKKLDKQFIHGLGHGVGTQVHEWPSVTISQDIELEENMVITIEPGLYVKNSYGMRIEDDLVVEKKRPLVLTKSTKDLIVV